MKDWDEVREWIATLDTNQLILLLQYISGALLKELENPTKR
jgi:hypothetical protein